MLSFYIIRWGQRHYVSGLSVHLWIMHTCIRARMDEGIFPLTCSGLSVWFIDLLTGVFLCKQVRVCFRRLSGAMYGSVQPLSEMLASCLHSRLSAHCHVINTHLLHVLRRDHSLLDCFTNIRVCPSNTMFLRFYTSTTHLWAAVALLLFLGCPFVCVWMWQLGSWHVRVCMHSRPGRDILSMACRQLLAAFSFASLMVSCYVVDRCIWCSVICTKCQDSPHLICNNCCFLVA